MAFNIMDFADALSADKDTQGLATLIESIMQLDDSTINSQSVEMICGAINGAFTNNVRESARQAMIEQFKEQNMTSQQVRAQANSFKQEILSLIDDEIKPSQPKRALLMGIFNPLCQIFDEVADMFGAFDIELPIKLDEGAQIPTYAHESDAAADVYSLETITIKAHTVSNKIRTGIHIQLPPNWCARIIPRSSTGAKTPLRLSNCQGLIDQGYTGEILVFYDNISDSDYTINAGDRIAQMWVEPIYRFKAKQVDTLQETDRNDGGFGSTGK